MKVKIDGHDVECSVEEYKELRKLEEKKKKKDEAVYPPTRDADEEEKPDEEIVVVKDFTKKMNGKKYHKIDWNKKKIEARAVIKKAEKPISMKALLKAIGLGAGGSNHRNLTSMILGGYGIRKVRGGYIHKSRVDSLKKKKVVAVVTHKTADNPKMDKVRERAKWVFTRANYLMKTDVRMNREKAMKIASQEWNTKKGILPKGTHLNKSKASPIVINDNFPFVFPLTRDSNVVFVTMFKSMLGSDEKKITYLEVKHHLMTDRGDWNGKLWRAFLSDIIAKSKSILSYFNMSGKLFVERDGGGHHVLRYEGGK